MTPRLAAQIAAGMHPEPTPYQLASRLERDRQAINESSYEDAALQQALRRFGVSSKTELPAQASMWIELIANQAVDDQVFGRNFDALFQTYRRQQRVYESAAWVSPTVAVQVLSMSLAGTDVRAHEHFLRAARAYGRSMEAIMNEDVAIHGWVDGRGREAWERVPPFEYEMLEIRQVLPDARGVLLAIACSFAAVCACLGMAARRLFR
jgi:ABC-2 type transport system permease protein